MTASRGRFIAVEGGEGVGKSTQVGLLAAALDRAGISVRKTREPGGSPAWKCAGDGGAEMDLNSIAISAISVLLAFSGFLAVAEALGFLPETVSRWLNRNRLAQTIAVLRDLGLDIDRLKRRNIASSLVEHFQISELPTRVLKALEPLTLKKAVGVGGTEVVQAELYIDLMERQLILG